MKIIVNVQVPFNFKHSLDYFSRSEKEIVDVCKDNVYWRVLDIKGEPSLAIVKSMIVNGQPALEIDVPTCRSTRKLDEVEKTIKRIFSLEQDIRPFYREISGDSVLNKLAKEQYGFKPPVTPSIYEALVWAVIGQQLNLSFIYSLKARVVMQYGSKYHHHSRRYYGFPSPEGLMSAGYGEMRKMQLSRRKAEYIMGLTRGVISGRIDLDGLQELDDEGALEQLMKIKGVGRWTAEYVLLRGLGRWSAIPADDIGIRNAVTHFYKYKKQVDGNEVRKRAEEWGRFKGCAAFYLLMAFQRYKKKGKLS